MDLLTEIYVSMSRNKLRIALTGFSIAWGIFLLIVLLSAGDGFLNAMKKNFESNTINTITVYPSWTDMPFEGLPKGRQIKFDENVKNLLDSKFSDQILKSIPSVTASVQLSFGEYNTSTSISAYNIGDAKWNNFKIVRGRDINAVDIKEMRKVLLMAEDTEEELMGKGGEALGKYINVGEMSFLVVGIFKPESQGQNYPVYSPSTTVGMIFNPEKTYNSIQLITDRLETAEENETFDDDIVSVIADYRRFDKKDMSAVWVHNSYEQFLQISQVIGALDIFIWLIGIASLIAGIVGVSNIMLITVRERTREFGIRKALGATPSSIIWLVLLEAIGITMLFGYIGMVVGLGLVKLIVMITYTLQPAAESVFSTPAVNLPLVIAANVTMIIAGIIAGYIPAKRAVSIKPVEALATI